MANLYVMEAANIFVGDSGPDNSKHLQVKDLKLPDLEELMATHHSGGSWGAISIGGLGMRELSASFKETGWDPQTMSQFGIGARSQFPFTVYGLLRNKTQGGAAMQAKAIMKGRLTRVQMGAHNRGQLMDSDYAISEILHYELYIGGAEKYYWDWSATIWRVDGVVQNQDELTMLAIP